MTIKLEDLKEQIEILKSVNDKWYDGVVKRINENESLDVECKQNDIKCSRSNWRGFKQALEHIEYFLKLYE